MYPANRWFISLIILSLVLITACESQASTPIVPLANSQFSTTYEFVGHHQYASNLQLSKSRDDIFYSAQVSNFAGKIITTVNDISLPKMELTLPVGEQKYFVTIGASQEDWLENITITVDPIQAESNAPTASDNRNIPAPARTACEIWTNQANTVNVFMRPLSGADVVLTLPVNIPFIADARTLDGWYRLTIDNMVGWVNGNTVILNGDCVALPVDTMIQPTAVVSGSNTAAYDVDRHYFAIDINQGSIFTNAVSFPNGDSTDTIQTTLSNVRANRTIGVIMTCVGTGADALRWGLSQTGNLRCGDTLELGFVERSDDLLITVMLSAVNGQQYVDYQLTAMPIAPSDEAQHILAVDRNRGGAIQQTISHPSGDSKDDIAVYIQNLTETSPNNFRELTLVMRCEGEASQNLRWGNSQKVGGCGDTIPISLSHRNNIHALQVWIPENVGQSFIDYALYAIPSAPVDDNYTLSIDRDYGGTFSEVISAPLGDLADNVQIIMTNLTASAPNNQRDMNITLYCDGSNIENVRWGVPGSPTLLCGQTVTSTFTTAERLQTIEIVPLDMNVTTYINYTLVIVQTPAVPITSDTGG